MNPLFPLTTFLILAYYTGLIIFFRKGLSPFFPVPGEGTSVSIVVSARNEEKNLPSLFDALAGQRYGGNDFEIILIDDRSSDRTLEAMRSFAEKKSGVRVLSIRDVPAGISPKKNALSRGIETAQGEIIVTTDADCRPGPDWLSTLVSAFRKDTGMVLGYAPYRSDGPYRSLFHRLLALEYFSMGAVAAVSANSGHPSTCNGANLAFRKRSFLASGGYGDSATRLSGDDDLLMHRIHRLSGDRVVFCTSKAAAVFNNPPAGLGEFVRQRIRFSSKHLDYPPAVVAALSGVYLFYCWMLILLIGSFFSGGCRILAALCIGFKTWAELAFLLRPAQKLLEDRDLLKYYPLIVIPHLFYVVLFPVLGQIIPVKWKDRP
jgi:cellulose synthase/poly-beta-1,6-N-acetylglucosamine synthase-like glycosyltransferase